MDAVGQYQRNKIDCDATCKLRSHTKKMKPHLFVKYARSAVHVKQSNDRFFYENERQICSSGVDWLDPTP